MRGLGLRTIHWQKTDDSLVRLADGSWRTMADARREYPDFDLTRSWALPDVPALPDESLEAYLRRAGFSAAQLQYTRRAYGNALGDDIARASAQAVLLEMRDTSTGEGDYRILEGYDSLIHALADGLDIRLNTVAQAVTWGGDGVRVQTADGAHYEADAVVMTLPLGVLQSGAVRFDPPLPAAKQAAIDRLHMGPALKMVYRFDTPILPEHIGAVYSALTPPMWWSPTLGRDAAGAYVWTAFTTGDWTRELLALGEEGALMRGLETLRAELDNPTLQPVAMRWMNWTDEPFTCGGYSVTPPGGTGLREALAAPLAGRLFWAGEAAASEAWAATVHGAYASGRRAAAERLHTQGTS